MNPEIEARITRLQDELSALSQKYEGTDRPMWPVIRDAMIQRIELLKRQGQGVRYER